MKIAMLTSGGDCQGLNATMRGVAKTLYNEFNDLTIYGILDGYKGLIECNYKELKKEDFSGILTLGGTILGTSRQPFKKMQVIEENGVLFPIEIKMSGNPKASMASANTVLDKIPDKKRGTGIILCLIDKKTYLRENLIALPIEYL